MQEELSSKEFREMFDNGEITADKSGRLKSHSALFDHEKVKLVQKPTLFPAMVTIPDDDDYRTVTLEINGVFHFKNKKADPCPKQSDRNMVDRIKSGPLKGDVYVFTNKHTGKRDVIQRHYQPSLITSTAAKYVDQIRAQLFRPWEMFTQEVEVVSCTFVFTALKSFTKKRMTVITEGGLVKKTTKPDIDNLWKMIGDVLETAGVYKNDSLIWKKNNITKIYGLKPKIILTLKGK